MFEWAFTSCKLCLQPLGFKRVCFLVDPLLSKIGILLEAVDDVGNTSNRYDASAKKLWNVAQTLKGLMLRQEQKVRTRLFWRLVRHGMSGQMGPPSFFV